MRQPLCRFFAVASLFAFVLLTGGCESTDPSPRGSVQGMVLAEGNPLPGVTVEVSGPLSASATTDGSGRYAFDDLPSGAYVVSIRGVPSDAAFPSTSRTAAVPEGGNITVDFQGSFIRTASISGTVTSRSQGLSGVTVRLEGTETATTQTDSEGAFRFSALRSGVYEIEISNFPSSVSFNPPRSEVQLASGQSYVTTFEGIPELSASVVIQSVVRRTSSGGSEAVEPDDVRGRIEVNVSMDRGQDHPDSLIVLLAGQVVGKQSFTGSSGSSHPEGGFPGGGPASTSIQELTFPVNTAAFDEETGAVRFFNGVRNLTVRLATQEGGPSASTATVPLTLRNPDTFVARVDPEAGPVAGGDGNPWIGGVLEVEVLPVVYTPERDVSSVVLELRRTGGSQIARQSAVGMRPFDFVFSPEVSGTSSLTGYQTPTGAVDQLRVIAAGYSQGGGVQGLPIVVAESLRIDQVPPEISSFRLPTQGPLWDCCRENWVGGEFLFADAVGSLEDAGVGGVTVQVHAGASSSSDTQLRSLDPIESGADLTATQGNTNYRSIAVLIDALGNERAVPLEPTTSNPASNERGGVFGVDVTPPQVALVTDGSGLPRYAVNPGPGSAWVLQATDNRSGIASLPFRSVVLRYAPSLGSEPLCVFPGGDCTPAQDGFVREVPDAGSGYYLLRTRVLDRAGNRSTLLEARVLRDSTAPEVGSLQVPSSPSGGQEVTVSGQAGDNVDLHLASVGIRFGDPGVEGRLVHFAEPEVIGTPFSSTLSPEGGFQARFPFAEGLEFVTSNSAPTGTILPATALVGEVVDAAGNRGVRTAAVSGSFQARSFGSGVRGAQGGIARWLLTSDGSKVCARTFGLEGDCSGPAVSDALTLQARARGAGGQLQNPFQTVYFLAIYPGDDVRYLGSTSQAVLLQDASGGEGRIWGWDFGWLPGPRIPPGSIRIIAVGVDSDGAAIRTLELTTIEVVQGT